MYKVGMLEEILYSKNLLIKLILFGNVGLAKPVTVSGASL